MFQRSIRTLAVVLTIVAVGLGLATTEARDKTAQRYMKLYFKASAKVEKERWDKVLALSERMERVAPNATFHLTLAAQANAQLGDHDAAYTALERWIETGWPNDAGLANVKLLEPLHDDSRYEELSAHAAQLGEAWKETQRQVHDVLPIVGAEPFDSAEALVAAFEARRNELSARAILIPGVIYSQRFNDLHDAEIASAGRYIADHPDAEDAADAALAAVRAATRYKQYWPNLDGDAAIVIATAERFIAGWPDSEQRPEVELARAVASWKAYGADEREDTLERRAKEAVPLFVALDERFADTPEATHARIWRMSIGMELNDGELTSEITELYDRVEATFEDDDALKQYAWEQAPLAMFQINGREFFDGTDLDGKQWNWETMRGKVVLIDFWATWCGPCIADIPHMQETYDKYREAGFEIVGVSLDGDDEKSFLEECADLGVEWPQIYDGKGWDAELARTFSISGVPTPVLIDRDGKVVGVHGQVRGDKLIEEVGKLID